MRIFLNYPYKERLSSTPCIIYLMSKLTKTNNILLTLIILVNGYMLVAPFLPEITFWVKTHDRVTVTKLHNQLRASTPKQHQPNHAIIPSMLLNQPVYEGKDTYTELNKGMWRWPSGSTPDKGGNTILIGHRFTYTTPQGVFYLLDKIKMGDEMAVVWNDKKYVYKVSNIQEVLPTQTNILNQTTTPTLTLYTCTPIWWPKHRLVVTAQLEPTVEHAR